jgi:hypothetical protein
MRFDMEIAKAQARTDKLAEGMAALLAGKRTEKLGHLHHTGEIRSSVKGGIRTIELQCECGRLLGPWQDV